MVLFVLGVYELEVLIDALNFLLEPFLIISCHVSEIIWVEDNGT